MLGLWHATHSTCSQKVRIALAEKRLPWTSHFVDLRRFQHLEPEFLALNPAAMVPVLQDGGQVIRESLVINEYLDDAYPEPALRPRNALERARMREWTLYIAEEPAWAVKVPSFQKMALELSVGQLVALDVAGLPLMRRWYIVNVQRKPLAPAAEAFRYFVLDQGERLLAEQFGGSVPVS